MKMFKTYKYSHKFWVQTPAIIAKTDTQSHSEWQARFVFESCSDAQK